MRAIPPKLWKKFDQQTVLRRKFPLGTRVDHPASIDQNCSAILLAPVDRLGFDKTRSWVNLIKASPETWLENVKALPVAIGQDVCRASTVPFVVAKNLFDIGAHAAATKR